MSGGSYHTEPVIRKALHGGATIANLEIGHGKHVNEHSLHLYYFLVCVLSNGFITAGDLGEKPQLQQIYISDE